MAQLSNSCTKSAILLLLLLFMFSSAPCLLWSCNQHLGHTSNALGSWETSIPPRIPAAAIQSWATSAAGCNCNCSAILGAANTSPVCLYSILPHSPVLSWESWQHFLNFVSIAQTNTCTCARTCAWNSTLGLDPKLHFAPTEESHSFQGSLAHTVLCHGLTNFITIIRGLSYY